MTTWRDVAFVAAWLWLVILIVAEPGCECPNPATRPHLQTNREGVLE